MTYADMVNLSMNQTLARSINTSLVAILPVLPVLVIGAELLGATTLQYFGLALVDRACTSGAYSSIFIASPMLAELKEREPRYATIRQRLANRADASGLLTPGLPPWPWPAGRAAPAAARRARAGRAQPGRPPASVLRPGAARRDRTAAGACRRRRPRRHAATVPRPGRPHRRDQGPRPGAGGGPSTPAPSPQGRRARAKRGGRRR